jgi:endonuclease/exonuclease/phosphatase (EEP) superfamily protein YafD
VQWRYEIRGAASGLAVVTAFLLALVSVNLDIPGQALLQSLRFHLAALMLVLVVALVVTRGFRRSILFALVLLVSVAEGGYFIYRMHEARGVAAEAPRTPFIRVLSFNILNSNYENGPAIAGFIKGSGADIVMVMEASPLFDHLADLATVYPAREGCDEAQTCDLMLLSKTPLTDAEMHDLGPTWRNRLITAHTVVDGEPFTAVAAHMVKPYFDWAAVGEAHTLLRVLAKIQGPMVLSGDFNAAPWSDNIEWLVRDGKLITAGNYPATWPVALGPLGVPIDNMFTRDGLFIDSLKSLDDTMGSNHRGLIAELSIAQ